jgi:dethiobiotin synthetase
MRQIIFVTGTDTGVGKTVLTALLLHHFRHAGVRALAMKPYCSGGRGDVKLLQSLQPGELSDAEMNPFYFAQPVAPFVAQESRNRPISLEKAVEKIITIQKRCEQLIVEGSGGLYVPLGKNYSVADLIVKLNCRVIVVARNQLGTINHTLLTIKALQTLRINTSRLTVVLMNKPKRDASTASNQRTITSSIRPINVLSLPQSSKSLNSAEKIRQFFTQHSKIMGDIAVVRKHKYLIINVL